MEGRRKRKVYKQEQNLFCILPDKGRVEEKMVVDDVVNVSLKQGMTGARLDVIYFD